MIEQCDSCGKRIQGDDYDDLADKMILHWQKEHPG